MSPLSFPNKLQQREDLQLDYIPGKAATVFMQFSTAAMLQKKLLYRRGFHSSASVRDFFCGTDSFVNNAEANVTGGSSPEMI